MRSNTERACLECDKIINGRSDKKFCDDGCRNVFNNRRNSESDEVIKTVNGILRKNRLIMHSLLAGAEKTTVAAKALKTPGFNFDYFTHLYETRSGTVYKFCYEFGYLQIDAGVYMLVKRLAKQ